MRLHPYGHTHWKGENAAQQSRERCAGLCDNTFYIVFFFFFSFFKGLVKYSKKIFFFSFGQQLGSLGEADGYFVVVVIGCENDTDCMFGF
jgi:hypothetical protein